MRESEWRLPLAEDPVTEVKGAVSAGDVRDTRERVGAEGIFVHLNAAAERQIERDLLEEALRANEREAGRIPQALRDEAADLFRSVWRSGL
ncbi:hypothetical protein ABZU32_32815 [Sphaerisporangium sp. NPDC005288]|uniref:hypothetical protein n=1 Tax=Sphaerisporangium sp. NPDC005288 TaxID=3155114 RepID=UPI0033A2E229